MKHVHVSSLFQHVSIFLLGTNLAATGANHHAHGPPSKANKETQQTHHEALWEFTRLRQDNFYISKICHSDP